MIGNVTLRQLCEVTWHLWGIKGIKEWSVDEKSTNVVAQKRNQGDVSRQPVEC